MMLLSESADAERWARSLSIPFYAAIEANGHNVSLLFADLVIDVIAAGHAPFVVLNVGPECNNLCMNRQAAERDPPHGFAANNLSAR